jgi:hypothetical protein
MRSPLLHSLLVLLLACAGVTKSAPPSVVTAAAPVARALRYAPGTARYRLVSHSHQEQQIEGNKQEGNFLLEYFVTVTLAPDTGQRLRFTATIDSMRAEGGMITAADINRTKGARLSGEMGADGQVTGFSGDTLLSGQMQAVASTLRQFFPRIPAQGAEPGRQWSDTAETKTSGSPSITLHSINDRRIGDWTEQGGQRALPIDVTAKYTITGTGQQMGQDFTLNGSGERVSRQSISAQGHYLGATGRDSSSVTVSLTSMGMTFPSIQLRSDTVSVLQ